MKMLNYRNSEKNVRGEGGGVTKYVANISSWVSISWSSAMLISYLKPVLRFDCIILKFPPSSFAFQLGVSFGSKLLENMLRLMKFYETLTR